MTDQNDDNRYLEIVPAHVRSELMKLLQANLSLRERWELAKARAEAQGHARMVIADFLIEEGLMKRVFSKKE
jgi:hypothetical protein